MSRAQIGRQMPPLPWMVEGARVHNRGDICNHAKSGTIQRVWPTRWGINVEVRYDDGSADVVTTNSFYDGPLGSPARFVQLHSYEIRPDVHERLERAAKRLGITTEEAIAQAVVMMEAKS